MITASVRRLEVFKAVAETGKFSAAAAALGIAQPSVSAHVKALERQAGQALFMRSPGRAPRLTQAGEAVYGYAIEVVRREAETATALDALSCVGPAEITVAAQRTLAHKPLSETLAAFVRTHRDVKLVTRCETGDGVVALLRAREVDIGIFLALGPVAGVDSDVLGAEELVIVAAPSHPLARRRSVSARDLSEHGFVGGLAASSFAGMVDVVLRRAGVRRHAVVVEAEDAATVKELVRHGAGIACCLATSVDEDVRRGTLVVLPLARPLARLEVRWAASPGRPLSAAALEFVQRLTRPKSEPR
jgi:DNA-binding transcriptional LysR family regulator